MTTENTTGVTHLLVNLENGDAGALEKLLPLVYDELRRIAAKYLRRERSEHTLQPTALVHEAYVRLVGEEIAWQNRAHFFGVAARLMRQILVDYARRHKAEKRGAGGMKFSLDEAINLSDERAAELVALDDALNALAKFDARKAKMVELRYFAGLTVEETCKILDISVATFVRQWQTTRAWLYHEITGGGNCD